MSFPATDLRWLSEMILGLHGCTSEGQLHGRLMPALHTRFRSTFSQVEEVAFDFSAYQAPCVLGGRPVPAGLLAALHDSPIVRRTVARDWPTATMHLAELGPRATLERTDFYNIVMRFLDLQDQMIATMRGSAEAMWSYGINRDTEFTADERWLFDCVRRHAQAALLRIRRTGDGLHGLPATTLWLGADLQPAGIDPTMRQLLAHYFPAHQREIARGRLPDELARWVRASLAMLAARPPPRPLTVFCTEAARGRLVVRLFPDQPGGAILLRCGEERRVPDPFALRRAGLTARECEVLFWIGEGKRDVEIASILGAAPKTVGKHVEHLLVKLGADNRGTAVRVGRAWQENIEVGRVPPAAE